VRIVVNEPAESTAALSSSARAEYAKAISIDATAKAELRMVVLRFYLRYVFTITIAGTLSSELPICCVGQRKHYNRTTKMNLYTSIERDHGSIRGC
jgi:hypothetical protein